MASRIPASNVTLPSIRTIFPPSTFSSPSPSSSDDDMPFMPLKQKNPRSHDQLYQTPRLPPPLSVPGHATHARRVSTASTYSVPSLTHSPSPSPSPPPSQSQHIRLVPCALRVADVVVVAAPGSQASSPRSSPTSPGAGTGATLLVGPAIARASKDDRKMHPYRVVRERKSQ